MREIRLREMTTCSQPATIAVVALMLPTMGHRAWFAYQALPRDEHGLPPKRRKLERDNKLANGALRKLIWDLLKRPGYETISRAAAALQCTPEWLMTGEGEGPKASWFILPRPPLPPPREEQASSESGEVPAVIATYQARLDTSRSDGVLRVSDRSAEHPPGGSSSELPDQREPARLDKKRRR